jgi:hypothetical protein
MDVERDHVAPAREEPSADEHRSDGDALGRLAPGRTGVRGGPSRSWAPADVAALQRTAGNAVVARLLAPGKAARSVIQRDLTTEPKDIETKKGPAELRDYLKGLKQHLKAYGRTKGSDKLLLLPLMLGSIKSWLEKYAGAPTGKASVESYKLKLQLEALKGEIEKEQLSAYVEAVRLGEFEYASFESEGQLRKTEELMSGKLADPLRGMGPQALKLIQDAGLTEAETLAIKVYTVGDYRTINMTLLGWADKSLTRALHEMGLVLDETGSPVLPPRVWAELDPTITKPSRPSPASGPKTEWEKKKERFHQYKFSYKPDLEKVRREARQHADMLMAAFSKMTAFNSRRTGKNTWRGMRLDPAWAEYTSYTTKGAVIDIKSFYSTSTEKSQAERFAKKKSADGREGFLLECVLKNGRDITFLSEHGKEKEVLVLPGAKLKVETTKPVKDPSYDRYVKVVEQ